jgi:predicted Fe-Mo cluster-binding NifX family protein
MQNSLAQVERDGGGGRQRTDSRRDPHCHSDLTTRCPSRRPAIGSSHTEVAMILCVPVTESGEVDPRWGRAGRVAVTEVVGGTVRSWEEFDVAWDRLHDEGSEGGHHARVARFVQEHRASIVVAGHMGDPMLEMLRRMNIDVRLGVSGDARQAVLAAAARIS